MVHPLQLTLPTHHAQNKIVALHQKALLAKYSCCEMLEKQCCFELCASSAQQEQNKIVAVHERVTGKAQLVSMAELLKQQSLLNCMPLPGSHAQGEVMMFHQIFI